MSGVVLAGSHAWNHSALERLRPRLLLPVVQMPLISYALRWLERGGVDGVIVCANAGTRRALEQSGLDANLALTLQFSEDQTPRGPAGCLKDAAARSSGSTLVVADGTTIPTVDLEPLLAEHWTSGAAVTLVAHEEPGQGGARSVLVPGGVYIFERRVLELVGASGFHDIKESLIPRLHRGGELVVTRTAPASCPRVLNSETYLAVNRWMTEVTVQRAELPEEYVVGAGVMAHVSARIASDAILVGPVVIGPDVTISSGATVVGPTVIGRGGAIRSGALVSRSVAWEHCIVGPGAMVDGSVVTAHAAVPAGGRVLGEVWALGAKGPRAVPLRRRVPYLSELWPSLGRGREARTADPRQPA